MAIFNSYFDITRGYIIMVYLPRNLLRCLSWLTGSTLCASLRYRRGRMVEWYSLRSYERSGWWWWFQTSLIFNPNVGKAYSSKAKRIHSPMTYH